MNTPRSRPLASLLLLLLPALVGCGTSFDPTVESSGGSEERGDERRCSSCLGSGKARYISGKTTNRYNEPPCSRCGGTGFTR